MVATSSRSRSRHQRSRDLEVDNSTNMHAWPNSNAASNRPPHSHRNGGRRTGTGSSISSGGSPRDHDALSDTVSHHSVSSAGVNWPVQRYHTYIAQALLLTCSRHQSLQKFEFELTKSFVMIFLLDQK